MANYDDYQLDEMEDAAVNKSKNLKRGLLAGAGVLGVGGTAAFAASQMSSDDEAPLTSEDLLAGANAGAENIEDAQEEATAQDNNTTHETVKEVHHTYVVENNGGESGSHPGAGEELDVNVRESSVLFDEEGNIVSTIDAGTVNGKDFMVIDNDLNGKGDVLAYDANGNGVYEDNEIVQLDNNSWEMGKGQEFHAYAQTEDGDIVEVYVDDPNGKSDIADIHNDFEDERTGEIYENDLAQNNPDYNNEDQQRAGFEVNLSLRMTPCRKISMTRQASSKVRKWLTSPTTMDFRQRMIYRTTYTVKSMRPSLTHTMSPRTRILLTTATQSPQLTTWHHMTQVPIHSTTFLTTHNQTIKPKGTPVASPPAYFQSNN